MQAVGAHAERIGEKAIAQLGQCGGYVNYEYYYQDAPNRLIIGHHDRYAGEAINNYLVWQQIAFLKRDNSDLIDFCREKA
jgi:hypothetical protein